MTDPKPGAIVHVELSTNDLGATRRFFEEVFGWKFKKEQTEGPEYWSFETPSGPGGGITAPQGGMPAGTMNYILVASVDAAVKKITGHGGKIVVPKQEIPRVGWFAVFEFPGGATSAIFQSTMG